MSISERKNEIKDAIKSFEKKDFQRSEYLDELISLQGDVVNQTFNSEHADRADLRIYDVLRYFESKNAELSFVSKEKLAEFSRECNEIENEIRREISGLSGERKAAKALYDTKCEKYILRNIEIQGPSGRTEIDDLVITNKGIFIVEVKNTKRNAFIDEAGILYKSGEYLYKDSELGRKMAKRESLIKELIGEKLSNFVPVLKIVAFTNSDIEVRNKYKDFYSCCFLPQLASLIEDYDGEEILSTEQMREIYWKISDKTKDNAYGTDINVDKFKDDFAQLLALLEETSTDAEETEEKIDVVKTPVEKIVKKAGRKDAYIAAGVAGGTIITLLVGVLGKRLIKH